MKAYKISIEIEADNEDEAKDEFFEVINENQALDITIEEANND